MVRCLHEGAYRAPFLPEVPSILPRLYRSEFGLLQFSHRAGTDVLDRGCLKLEWKQFYLLSMRFVSFRNVDRSGGNTCSRRNG